MYGIYGNIYHQYTPNVTIYSIHGSYGVGTNYIFWFIRISSSGSFQVTLEPMCFTKCCFGSSFWQSLGTSSVCCSRMSPESRQSWTRVCIVSWTFAWHSLGSMCLSLHGGSTHWTARTTCCRKRELEYFCRASETQPWLAFWLCINTITTPKLGRLTYHHGECIFIIYNK